MSESEPVRGFEKGGVIARLQAESDAFDLQRAKEEGFATLKEWNDYHSSRTEYLWEVLEKEGDSGEFFCDDPEANPKAGYNPKKCSCQGLLFFPAVKR